MSRAAWPSPANLKDFLAGAGIVASPPAGDALLLDYAGAVAEALELFEDQTGYHPFMAAVADATRHYSPDGSDVLDLRGGVAAALTSLTVGYSPTSAGTALTVNQDYWLKPINALAEGRPANYIQFAGRQSGTERSIVIVGKFGYCANGAIPEAAYQAVLRLASVRLLPQIQSMASQGGLKRLTEGDVTYEWDLTSFSNVWQADARRNVAQFKRLSVT